jgi:predicted porin
MKKVLVTLATIGLMAGTAINYSAADVTVYGRAHLSVDSLDNGTDSSLYLSSNASRLGFKGSQELGMGLTGEFQYEVSYDPTKNGLGGARTNFLALSGDFGKLVLGRLDSASKSHMDHYQMFGDQIGDAGNFLGDKGQGVDHVSNAVDRFSNMIAYQMPTTNNLSASIAYVPEEGNKDTGGIIIGGEFSNENIFVGLSNASLKKGNKLGGTDDQQTTQILGNYKVSDTLRVMAVYQTTSNLRHTNTAKLTVIGAGVSYGFNPETTFKTHYYKADATASDAKDGATMLATGVDYALSDTTTVYFAYAAVTNEDNADYTSLNWGHEKLPAISAGKDPSGISIGAVYKF